MATHALMLRKPEAIAAPSRATPHDQAMVDDRAWQRYRRAFAGRGLPLAFVDLDLLERNALNLVQRAGGLPIRLATKSLRCVPLLHRLIAQHPGIRGLMPYSAAEAAWLADLGFDDLLIGYPTLATAEIRAVAARVARGARITFMVDDERQLPPLVAAAREAGCVLRLCLDVDLSMRLPGLNFGVYRSPIRHADAALRLAAAIAPYGARSNATAGLQLVGVMGYEGQIAGVPDAVPGAFWLNLLMRVLKRWSQHECFPRRQAVVQALREAGLILEVVNGGGTGSLEVTRGDPVVTELTAGSGFYGPALFDHFRDFSLQPAAGFALPVVRQALPGVYALAGGGYVASGPVGADKQPRPYLPRGIELVKTLGAGEVQTSIRSQQPLELGEPVLFRHAKAGELCERFKELHLVRGDRVEEVVPTYRGQGQSFF